MFLEGYGRRAWFLLQEGAIKEFRILITQDALSIADAKALAKQLQTAKEHNLREIGKQCLAIKKANQNLTQAEIATQVGLSQAGVSKAIKAANIPDKLVKLFPVVNALSHPDYTLLDKVTKVCGDSENLTNFVSDIDKKFVNIQPEYSAEDQKDLIISLIKSELKIVEEKKITDKAEITSLAEFNLT